MERKEKRPQDYIPDERITLYIIRDYGRLIETNERLAEYARLLETEIEHVKDVAFNNQRNYKNEMLSKGMKNAKLMEKVDSLSSENKKLKNTIMELRAKIRKLENPLPEDC